MRWMLILVTGLLACSKEAQRISLSSPQNFYPPPADSLVGRLRDVQMVFVGTALKIKRATECAELDSLGGGPEFHWATVSIDKSIRGNMASPVKVLFSTDTLGLWRYAPKIKVHEKSIFLLQYLKIHCKRTPLYDEVKDDKKLVDTSFVRAFTVFNPLDYEPMDSLTAVRRIIFKMVADSITADSVRTDSIRAVTADSLLKKILKFNRHKKNSPK